MTDKIDTILVVGTQRSGTTWIMQLLSQVVSFKVYGEVFREISVSEFAGDSSLKPVRFYLDYAKDKENCSPINYVNDVLRLDERVVVCKVMYDQIRRNPRLISLLRKKNVLVINFERKDIFEIALSKCIARETGVFHSENGIKETTIFIKYRKVYELMVKEIVKKLFFPYFLRYISKNYSYFVYEEALVDISPLENIISDVTPVKNIKLRPDRTRWKKVDKATKYRTIGNFSEIKDRLENSILRRFVS